MGKWLGDQVGRKCWHPLGSVRIVLEICRPFVSVPDRASIIASILGMFNFDILGASVEHVMRRGSSLSMRFKLQYNNSFGFITIDQWNLLFFLLKFRATASDGELTVSFFFIRHPVLKKTKQEKREICYIQGSEPLVSSSQGKANDMLRMFRSHRHYRLLGRGHLWFSWYLRLR